MYVVGESAPIYTIAGTVLESSATSLGSTAVHPAIVKVMYTEVVCCKVVLPQVA